MRIPKINITSIIIGIFIAIIIFVFAVTGFQSQVLSQQNSTFLAEVNGEFVERRDLESLIRNLSAGKTFTPEILETIRPMLLQQLISKKLLSTWANSINLQINPYQVHDLIKDNTMFQKDGKFDLSTYKDLLNQNQMTPESYEKKLGDDLLSFSADLITRSEIISSNFEEELTSLQKNKKRIHIIKITPQHLEQFITIDKSTLETALLKPEFLEDLEKQYESQKERFSIPGQYILEKFKVTKEHKTVLMGLSEKNFSSKTVELLAKDIGYLSEESYPETSIPPYLFDSVSKLLPGQISKIIDHENFFIVFKLKDKTSSSVKSFAEVKESLAIQKLQQEDNNKNKELFNQLKVQISAAFMQGKISKALKIVQDYQLPNIENAVINRLTSQIKNFNIPNSLRSKIFKASSKSFVEEGFFMSYVAEDVKDSNDKKEETKLVDSLKTDLRKQFMDYLSSKASIKTKFGA